MIAAFWRFRAWTVPLTIGIGLLAGLVSLAAAGTSTATTTLFLTDPGGAPLFDDGSSTPSDVDRHAQQRAEFAQSANVRSRVVADLDAQRAADPSIPVESVESLGHIVHASTTSSSDMRVDCTTDDQEHALRICRSVVVNYVDLSNQDTQERAEVQVAYLLAERDRIIADAESQPSSIAEIDVQIAEIRAEAALFGSGVEFVEPPAVREDSRSLPAVRAGIAGMLVAALAVAVVAFFWARRRPIISSGADAGAALSAPLLGEIATSPRTPFAAAVAPGAAYQLLATSLGAVHPEGGVLLAGAATPSRHAADTIARMATASAREGRRVLVIDSDSTGRQISRLFGQQQTRGGLTEWLAGLAEFDEVRRSVGVGGAATLDLITCGRPIDEPSGLLRSQQARDAIGSLRSRYDLVLVAIPPLLTAAEGSALAAVADGVVLIVERGTGTDDLATIRQRLDVLRSGIVGIVFDHRSGTG